MGPRGWQRERKVVTTDTAGQQVEVVTGITTDPEGRPVAAIAIGDGPTALLPLNGRPIGTAVTNNIRQTLEKAHAMDRESGR